MPDPSDRNDLAPMTKRDIEPSPADASFRPAPPLKDAGVEFQGDASGGGSSGVGDAGDDASSAATKADAGSSSDVAGQAKEAVGEAAGAVQNGAAGLRGQAVDRARLFAEDGKSKATDALGQLTQLLNDAATQVDDKLGEQYGQYARNAAGQVQSFATSLDDKSVDELFDQARELVKKSPGVAVGVAAAVGFAVARLVSAGVDQRDA